MSQTTTHLLETYLFLATVGRPFFDMEGSFIKKFELLKTLSKSQVLQERDEYKCHLNTTSES